MRPSPLVLIILDGWGQKGPDQHNAIANARTPTWDALWDASIHTTLSASGLDVGLPEGQMGNSEVGHLTMGAGRTVFQDLTRISNALDTGQFEQNPVFLKMLNTLNPQTLHLLGLLSPGGVHSHEEHLFALLRFAANAGVQTIHLHLFLDGRDTPPQSAESSLRTLQALIHTLPCHIHIASLSGRFYAMDRDQRWERTQRTYELLMEGKARFKAASALEALHNAYDRHETDEFVQPTLIEPFNPIVEADTVLCMNFRSDRMRQLCYALLQPTFPHFSRSTVLDPARFFTLTEYDPRLKTLAAFPPLALKNHLGEYLQQHRLRQLRIAETEKYAHVTFFFNGGLETPFEGEDRILIPSKKVATYDLCPEMSAPELTQQLVHAIQAQKYDLIICNYANADMVGHTGHFSATLKAIEILDTCLYDVMEALKRTGGEALITSDHGNAECMYDARSDQPHTAHTTERVPFVYVGTRGTLAHEQGTLADIAPTLLCLLGLPVPPEMTGQSLLSLRTPIDFSRGAQYDNEEKPEAS